jgi:hypothetical protein
MAAVVGAPGELRAPSVAKPGLNEYLQNAVQAFRSQKTRAVATQEIAAALKRACVRAVLHR